MNVQKKKDNYNLGSVTGFSAMNVLASIGILVSIQVH